MKDATTNSEQITTWWKKWPRSNIGVATGDESGIVVLDLDPRKSGDESITERERELGALPTTVTSLSGGGGRHLFFKHPGFAVRKDTAGKAFGPGVDLLSNGSIVIVPPSRHISGQRYRWEKGKSYRDLEPVPLPEPWLARLRGNTAAQLNADSAPAQPSGLIREGGRNNHLTSVAGTLQRNDVSPEAITAALKAENAARCSPPLDIAEIEKIVASVTTYLAAPLGVTPKVATETDLETLLSADDERVVAEILKKWNAASGLKRALIKASPTVRGVFIAKIRQEWSSSTDQNRWLN